MTQCGTVRFVAPEVLSEQRYKESADVYSFGMVLWEMATRTQVLDFSTLMSCNFKPNILRF